MLPQHMYIIKFSKVAILRFVVMNQYIYFIPNAMVGEWIHIVVISHNFLIRFQTYVPASVFDYVERICNKYIKISCRLSIYYFESILDVNTDFNLSRYAECRWC